MPIETGSEPPRFSHRTDPCRGHVATSHAFGSSQNSAKDAVTAGTAHSNPIATHRIRHATGFLQTTLSKLPRQSPQQPQLRARGSPDRVLTFLGTYSAPLRYALDLRPVWSYIRKRRCGFVPVGLPTPESSANYPQPIDSVLYKSRIVAHSLLRGVCNVASKTGAKTK
jgi:hypothetical protein